MLPLVFVLLAPLVRLPAHKRYLGNDAGAVLGLRSRYAAFFVLNADRFSQWLGVRPRRTYGPLNELPVLGRGESSGATAAVADRSHCRRCKFCQSDFSPDVGTGPDSGLPVITSQTALFTMP